MHYLYLQTELAKKILKPKDNEMNTTRRPRVSGMQSGVTISKCLHTYLVTSVER